MAEQQKPLVYLKTLLNEKGDFLAEWKKLDQADKDKLRQWAIEEMESETK